MNPQSRKLQDCISHSASDFFCLCYTPKSFYSHNPKPLKKGGFLFCLIWFFTAYVQYSSYVLTPLWNAVTWLAFEGEAKILICFSLRKKNLWNLFRAGARQWGNNLYCNPQRNRTWIELMLLQDMGFSSYE